MQFDGAVIREQGVTLAIVLVKPHVVQSTTESQRAIRAFQRRFPGMPVVLMGQDARGVPTYFGCPDIVRFLSRVPVEAIPWKRYTA